MKRPISEMQKRDENVIQRSMDRSTPRDQMPDLEKIQMATDNLRLIRLLTRAHRFIAHGFYPEYKKILIDEGFKPSDFGGPE